MTSNRDDDIQQFPSKEAFWRFHSSRWEQGGISQRAYCTNEAIPLASFQYWREKLSNQTKAIIGNGASQPMTFAQTSLLNHDHTMTVPSAIQLHLSKTVHIEWPITATQELAKFLKEYTA